MHLINEEKMKINYNSDITKVATGIIVQGVNCQRAMGSGLAKAIYTKWPIVREEFMQTEPEIGTVLCIKVANKLWVANCYTQEFYGYDGRKYASVAAIDKCLHHVCTGFGITKLPIHIAKIGCDLGGLDWITEVEPIIDSYAADFDITVHEIKNERRVSGN